MVASCAPVIGSRATTKMVSSPAIVPTTSERFAGSLTKGDAHERSSAHPYNVAAD